MDDADPSEPMRFRVLCSTCGQVPVDGGQVELALGRGDAWAWVTCPWCLQAQAPVYVPKTAVAPLMAAGAQLKSGLRGMLLTSVPRQIRRADGAPR